MCVQTPFNMHKKQNPQGLRESLPITAFCSSSFGTVQQRMVSSPVLSSLQNFHCHGHYTNQNEKNLTLRPQFKFALLTPKRLVFYSCQLAAYERDYI